MAKAKDITVSLDMNTDKMQLKLRAIEKHAGALADDLDRIDSMNDEDFNKLKETTISIGVTNSENAKDIAKALKICAHEFL
ncbi:hypothetical protein ACOMCU_25615 [Lysinibacillus sp. UGB7]|uniref:hypothetical protein n=1 Tax=Lysinibacillus sp. UGB7 TaxID=3411039 RepID=UPI003B8138B6